jgi:hypothetical protein
LEEKYGVMFIIKRINNGIAFIMKIGDSYQCNVQFASDENLTSEDYEKIGDGIVIILYEPLKQYITMKFMEYVAHKCGLKIHSQLAEINLKAEQCTDYFKNL